MKHKVLLTLLLLMLTSIRVMAEDEQVFTAPPSFSFLIDETQGLIQCECEPDAVIYADINGDQLTFSDGDLYTIDRTNEDQEIEVYAYAQAEGKEPSPYVSESFMLPALPASPTIAPNIQLISYTGGTHMEVILTNVDDNPDAAIYYKIYQRYYWDDEWFDYGDWYLYTEPLEFWGDHYETKFYRIEAYAVADGHEPSEHVFAEFMVERVSSHNAPPYDFAVDGIYYCINGSGYVEVARSKSDPYCDIYWEGDRLVIDGGHSPSYSGDVVIPSTVTYGAQTYTVVGIGNEAFWGCDVTSLTLPNTLTRIGDYAFAFTTSIESMAIPESVTSIGQGAFYNSTIKDLNIPERVTSIGKGAFGYCSSLNGIDIPEGITVIEDAVFSHCGGISDITIPAAVTSIGEFAFAGCTGLTSMDIPAAVTSIENSTFEDCTGLTSVSLPSGIRTIGDYAFSGCIALPDIALPASVTSIGNYAFTGCTVITGLNLPSSLTSIGYSAFARCTALSTMVIPNGVTTIGNSAFMGCTDLTNVTLPSSLQAISYNTFSGCTSLTDITIPGSVTSISYYAFSDCAALTSVVLPASVTSISTRAFEGCSSLVTLQVDENNPVYDSRDNCNAIISSADNVLTLGCQNTVIPGSVTSIGECAFSGCTGLSEMTIPNSVTSIGDYAFFNCMGMTAVSLPESLTTIGKYAFFYCMGLADITIPASVETIGNNAFYCCNGLENVTCLATTPPAVDEFTFVSCYGATLHVPAGSLEDYAAADYWNRFAAIQPIGGNVPGDLSGDGVLTVQDVTRLIDLVLSGGEYSSVADVNGDGQVNIQDVTILIRMVLGGGQ